MVHVLYVRFLSSFAAHQYRVIATCKACGHRKWLDTDLLIARLGPDYDIQEERAAEQAAQLALLASKGGAPA